MNHCDFFFDAPDNRIREKVTVKTDKALLNLIKTEARNRNQGMSELIRDVVKAHLVTGCEKCEVRK